MDIRDDIRTQLQILRERVANEDFDSPLRKNLLGKIEELRKDFQDVCFEMDKPDEIRLADALHERLCNWNHADGCGWFYEKWEDDREGGAREKYRKMAKQILEEFTIKQALKFIELIKR